MPKPYYREYINKETVTSHTEIHGRDGNSVLIRKEARLFVSINAVHPCPSTVPCPIVKRSLATLPYCQISSSFGG